MDQDKNNFTITNLQRGADVIKEYVNTLPDNSGVYRMLGVKGNPLYVGKAKNLKKRVISYTIINKLPIRLQRMVNETYSMEFVTTNTESEALLLEANLIKKLQPMYNVLLKDGKTFQYIFIQKGHPWPRVTKLRGAQNENGTYYGPFASADAVEETLTAIYRSFLLRSCSDNVFASRTRPCLQYHIKRCSAPCVGWVSDSEYKKYLSQAKEVLSGKSNLIQHEISKEMMTASKNKEYERAAILRDRLKALAKIQSQQIINVAAIKNADVLAITSEGGKTCVQAFFFRNGSNYGTSSFFPSHSKDEDIQEVFTSFIMQFYEGRETPPEILINMDINDKSIVEKALNTKITLPKLGRKKDLILHAEQNAKNALKRKLIHKATQQTLLDGLAQKLALPNIPKRIEVYDNSHIQGTNQVGAMIVAGPEGFMKQAYRKFNIKGDIAPGDDYAMMREVLTRRFKKSLDHDYEKHTLPDLVIIDGGLGQFNAAYQTMADLGVADIPILSISKGKERKDGEEKFFMLNQKEFRMEKNDPVFYYLERIRDEAHRFAITTHRNKRAKELTKSMLDDIPGIGAKRKKALLEYFGSARGVSEAGLKDLIAVEGISEAIAKVIYYNFHEK